MSLVSNLPYPYLSEVQNDYFAGVRVVKPDLTVAEQIATALGIVPRYQFEQVNDAIKLLDHYWNAVKGWGRPNRLIHLSVDDYRKYPCQLVGLSESDAVQYPSDWMDDLNYFSTYQLKPFVGAWTRELVMAERAGDLPECFSLICEKEGGWVTIRGIKYHRLTLKVHGTTYIGETDE